MLFRSIYELKVKESYSKNDPYITYKPDEPCYFRKGVITIDYIFSYEEDYYRIPGFISEIKSDTTLYLEPWMHEKYDPEAEAEKAKYTISKDIPELVYGGQLINMGSVYTMIEGHSEAEFLNFSIDANVADQGSASFIVLNQSMNSLSEEEGSRFVSSGFLDWSVTGHDPKSNQSRPQRKLPSPIEIFLPIAKEHKTANSLYLFSAHSDDGGNPEFHAITTEKEDDEYLQLTDNKELLRINIKYFSVFTLVYSSR